MSGKSPHARNQKKTPQKTILEKRAEKREKQGAALFIKPRKDAKR